MASREEFFTGKCKWAYLNKPDPKFNSYSLMLYPDAESLDKINKLKTGKPAILNELRKDEDGYFMKFKRDAQKMIRGVLTPFSSPIVTKADGTVMPDPMLGNGSDVTIGCDIYTYRKGEGLAVRLKTVRVNNLVPFTPKSMDEEQKKQFGGMGAQPTVSF